MAFVEQPKSMFTQLKFTYEQELHPEEFFIPYVWKLVVSQSGVDFNLNTIHLFQARSPAETGDYSKWGFTFEKPIALQAGENHIALLSMTVGFQNIGAFFDTWPTGIDGPVKLSGLRNAPMDLSFQTWSYQILTAKLDAEPIIQGCCSNTGPVLDPIFHASLGVEIVIHIVRRKDSEVQQLMNIFRFLGTPNEEVWPGVTKLKDCHIYLEWKPQDISCSVPDLEPSGLDLLSAREMLVYEPSKRISAKKALDHPYFEDLDKSQF